MNQSDYPMCLRPTLTNENPTSRRRRFFGGWVLVLTLVLGACNPAEKAPQFALTNITGASFGKELNLPDHNGKMRSEEHTSELQSQSNLVCRLLLEKKKKQE